MTKVTYRTLKHGEPIPVGEPGRYRDAAGYAILRWKVAPSTYVECKEHRFVLGVPPDHFHVHHKDGNKANNDPGNLELLTHSQHSAEHQPRTWDIAQAARLYGAGLSLPDLGRIDGVHCTNILRGFQKSGVARRPSPKDQNACKNGHAFTPENTYYYRQ